MSIQKQESVLTAGFALFSVLTSFVFIFYGVRVLGSQTASDWLTAFAYLTAGYGLVNIYVLSWAWRSRVNWAPGAMMLFSLCYLGIFLVDNLRAGIHSLSEIVVMLVVAFVLWINWLTTKKVIARP